MMSCVLIKGLSLLVMGAGISSNIVSIENNIGFYESVGYQMWLEC